MEEIGVGNRELIADGVEVLRRAYEKWLNEKIDAGNDVKFMDGQMIAHNFLKLAIYHIARESEPDDEESRKKLRKYLLVVAISTLRKTLENIDKLNNETDPLLS